MTTEAKKTAAAETSTATSTAKNAVADGAVKKRRRLRGVVVCSKADKTVRVRIERLVRHPLYEKIIRRHRHVQAHDADNRCQTGDIVMLEEHPRFSKTKSWCVVAAPAAGEKQ